FQKGKYSFNKGPVKEEPADPARGQTQAFGPREPAGKSDEPIPKDRREGVLRELEGQEVILHTDDGQQLEGKVLGSAAPRFPLSVWMELDEQVNGFRKKVPVLPANVKSARLKNPPVAEELPQPTVPIGIVAPHLIASAAELERPADGVR